MRLSIRKLALPLLILLLAVVVKTAWDYRRLRGEKVHELDIMQLLQHSSLGVTAGYAHGTPTVIQSAVDKLAEPRGPSCRICTAGRLKKCRHLSVILIPRPRTL